MNNNKISSKNIIIRKSLSLIIFYEIIILIWLGIHYFIENKNIKQEQIKQEQRLEKINTERKIIAKTKRKKEKEYLNYIKNVDLEIDTSLTKYVNNKIPYNKVFYIPDNLVPVEWKYIIDWKWWSIKVRKILKENLERLAVQFFEETDNNIVVVSGYREYLYQKWIKKGGCPGIFCAKAWYSEHQSGLAIDIYTASSKRNWANNNNLREYYIWLDENAYKYWFTNTYKKGIEVDWYGAEPWHWRYIWIKLAKYLHENEITFAEFYNKKIENNNNLN